MALSGMILIREVADAPVIMGISKSAGLKFPCGEVRIVNPLFVGIDVSSKSNVAYLMNPDGSKHSIFSVQNNLGGAKLLSERIVSALSSMRLNDVVIGLEATSIYGTTLCMPFGKTEVLAGSSERSMCLTQNRSKSLRNPIQTYPRMISWMPL